MGFSYAFISGGNDFNRSYCQCDAVGSTCRIFCWTPWSCSKPCKHNHRLLNRVLINIQLVILQPKIWSLSSFHFWSYSNLVSGWWIRERAGITFSIWKISASNGVYFTYNFCACKRFTSVVIILSSRKPEYLVRLLAGEVGSSFRALNEVQRNEAKCGARGSPSTALGVADGEISSLRFVSDVITILFCEWTFLQFVVSSQAFEQEWGGRWPFYDSNPASVVQRVDSTL